MPTYEYECQKCQKHHEVFQSITAKALTKCPHCKQGRLKRLLGTGSGFLFKGSGFYITDYRSKSYQDAKKKDQSNQDAKKKDQSHQDGKKKDQSGSSSTSSTPKPDSPSKT